MKTCGQCNNFTGAGDWGLCCTKPPQKAKGYIFGWLCYSDTNADDCENFTPAINKCEKCVYELTCGSRGMKNKCFKYKRDAPDGGYYG